MCLKVVIEDPVEDTKFAQEMFKKNTFSLCTSIAARQIELYGSAKISNVKKPITYSFEAQIEIRLNQYLKDIISHLLEGFLERETLGFMQLGFCNQIFFISPDQRVLVAFLVCLWVL